MSIEKYYKIFTKFGFQYYTQYGRDEHNVFYIFSMINLNMKIKNLFYKKIATFIIYYVLTNNIFMINFIFVCRNNILPYGQIYY